MELIIRRTRSTDGYLTYLLCPVCDGQIKRLDAQSPVWSIFVALDDHMARDHRTERWDDAVGMMNYRQPRRKIETLQLPDM